MRLRFNTTMATINLRAMIAPTVFTLSFNTTMATINLKNEVAQGTIENKFQYHNGYD